MGRAESKAHNERAGDSLTPDLQHASQAWSRRRLREAARHGMRRHVEVNATIAHPVERVFPLSCRPLALARVCAGLCLPSAHRRSAAWASARRRIATDRIGPFTSTSSMSWPCLSRTVARLGSRPRRGTRESSTSARRLGATDIEARYEGDISGFLRLLTWWLPMGVVLDPVAGLPAPRPAARTGSERHESMAAWIPPGSAE